MNFYAPIPISVNKVAAIGMFDGVHAGHRLLIDTLRHTAASIGLDSVVFTFAEHPASVLRPGSEPPALLTPQQRVEQLRRCGIDEVVTLHFTPELAKLTAAEFVLWLRDNYNVRHLVLGYDTKMGSDRVSSSSQFEAICRPLGIEVSTAPQFVMDGVVVSSSTIRRALAHGDVRLASKLLGRSYSLTGTVVHGNGNGTGIGFPTANLEIPPGMAVPCNGVYAAGAQVDEKVYPAMVNIGLRPTLDDGRGITIEAHLMGYDGNLYDRNIKLEFVERLRDERKFDSLDALRRQLADDAADALAALRTK